MNGFYASASRAFISLLLSWTSASKKIDSFTKIWLPTVKTPTHNLNVAAVISGPIYPMPVKSAQNQMSGNATQSGVDHVNPALHVALVNNIEFDSLALDGMC